MYSTPTQSKVSDYFSPSAIRADMMKIQQLIHRVHVQFDQVSQLVPSNLPNDLSALTKQMEILDTQIDAEKTFDYPREITNLENKINKLEQKLNEYENSTQIQNKRKNLNYDENTLSNLEHRIATSNNSFLEQLHQNFDQRLSYLAPPPPIPEPKVIDFKLSINFPSNSETKGAKKQDEQIIHIETTSTLDPRIHLRVQRHSERIKLVEDDFDSLLMTDSPTILPQKQLQLISSISENNKQQIKELETKFTELESSLRNIKQEKQAKIEKKKKMKEEDNIPGAIKYPEFSEYANKIFKKFNDLSSEISIAQSEVDNSIFTLEDHLNSIDVKINNYNQTASDFKALINLTDRRISDVELKIQKKKVIYAYAENPEDKIKLLAENSENKIKNLFNDIKAQLNDLTKSISDIKNEIIENKAKAKKARAQKNQAKKKNIQSNDSDLEELI